MSTTLVLSGPSRIKRNEYPAYCLRLFARCSDHQGLSLSAQLATMTVWPFQIWKMQKHTLVVVCIFDYQDSGVAVFGQQPSINSIQISHLHADSSVSMRHSWPTCPNCCLNRPLHSHLMSLHLQTVFVTMTFRKSWCRYATLLCRTSHRWP